MYTHNRIKINAGLLLCTAILLAFGAGNAHAVTEDFKLTAIDAEADDRFGNGVAARQAAPAPADV